MRCGCLVVWALVLAAVAGCALLIWLITRPIGPPYNGATYVVTLPGGGRRTDTISTTAARSFDAKVAPRLSPGNVSGLLLNGVELSEQELNSKLASELAANPLRSNGWKVDRVFIELHPAATRGYLYLSGSGIHVILSAELTFALTQGTGQVRLGEVRAGELTLGPLVRWALDLTGTTQTVQQLLQVALPAGVTAIDPHEGSLHVAVGPLAAQPTSEDAMVGNAR